MHPDQHPQHPPAPDRWLVVEVERPDEVDPAALLVDELSERLAPLGARGIEEEAHALRAYLPASSADDEASLLDRLREALERPEEDASLPYTHRWQPHEDWSEIWRRGLAPRRITDRIVVTPTWMEPEVRAGDRVISLDPGMAFGTAEHPTTRACLRLLDSCVEADQRIADVGAGSGILSIAAVLLGAEHVTAVEMDAWSCAAARENADVNGVADRIEVLQSRIDSRFLPDLPPFDGIVANIESGVLIPLLDGFRSGLVASGWLVLSGILSTESADVREATAGAGFELEKDDVEEGWWTASFRLRPDVA